ncbi:hypothetical protein [Brumicola nitratireducens]|uniref:Uncharacterized protein n=1 Tax=Glaciecola nitratireducens (strain JCM 12485 / KCTC 12276 / FR1064) TaxID=1085623 RepID=G4QNI3_GLANF|nr:hypothetical protein [Glaciecola nitratireducens]AEP31787.1 hypothetical protein GNIT_3693 [Glaciecola nitratireducens FR1064]
MVQTKLIELTNKSSSEKTPIDPLRKNVFERNELCPFSFEPNEDDIEAVLIARHVLSKRNDKDVSSISSLISRLIDFGEEFSAEMTRNRLKSMHALNSVRLLEARTLFTLRQYFTLEYASIKRLLWSEVFAVLVLTQAAEKITLSKRIEPKDKDDVVAQSIWHAGTSFLNELPDELVDSLARLECIYEFERDTIKRVSKGGKAKSEYIEPLRQDVFKAFIEHYSNLPAKKAALKIKADFERDNNNNLLRSAAEDLHLQFAKWINALKQGKMKYNA